MKVGILGAVSYEPIIEREVSRTDVKTRFGDVRVLEGTVGDATAYYIRRFGQDNDMRSDIVNHAAHALAFRQLGVRRVITLNGFGIVNRDFGVGELVVYDDYIRMCERFPTTVFADDKGWFRANMNFPFCPGLRRALVEAARAESDRTVHDGAINICVQGPYNETTAEIELYRRWGADIVCTTIYPEVVYFRELEMCFAGLSWLSDVAGEEDERDWVMITAEELAPIMRRAIGDLDAPSDCRCRQTWPANDESLPDWYRAIR